MATAETISKNPSVESPELSTALLELQYMKIWEMQRLAAVCDYPPYKDNSKAMMEEFCAPFHQALSNALHYLFAGKDGLTSFFHYDLPGAIFDSETFRADLELIAHEKMEQLTEERQHAISEVASYGFVAGMIFSATTGVRLTLPSYAAASSQEVANA